MASGYDDRDAVIWMDGKLVPWRNANIHILTHAMHYASSVFEGERAYNGKIFESVRHSERLLKSGEMIDMPIPWTVDQIEEAKYEVLKANGLTDAYVRAVAFRGAGEDMGVSSAKNPIRLAVAEPAMHQRAGQSAVGARPHHQTNIGALHGGVVVDVDDNQLRAPVFPGLGHVGHYINLGADSVGAPDHNQVAVRHFPWVFAGQFTVAPDPAGPGGFDAYGVMLARPTADIPKAIDGEQLHQPHRSCIAVRPNRFCAVALLNPLNLLA